MSNALGVTLKPYLYPHIKPGHRNAYIAFFYASRACLHTETTNDSLWSSLSYQRRLKALRSHRPIDEDPEAFPSVLYPRIKDPNVAAPFTSGKTGFRRPSDINVPASARSRTSIKTFKKKYDFIENGESWNNPDDITTLYGTV
jgi:hypothetical protein